MAVYSCLVIFFRRYAENCLLSSSISAAMKYLLKYVCSFYLENPTRIKSVETLGLHQVSLFYPGKLVFLWNPCVLDIQSMDKVWLKYAADQKVPAVNAESGCLVIIFSLQVSIPTIGFCFADMRTFIYLSSKKIKLTSEYEKILPII